MCESREENTTRSAAPFQPHPQAVLRTERDRWRGHDLLAGLEPQPPPARERGEQENTFHPGEPLADADAGATAEGKVGELRPRRLGFGTKALRIEALGIREPARIMVRDPLARDDDRALRHG